MASGEGAPAVLPALHLVDLVCRRGTRVLFSGVRLTVPPGAMVWLRGANGRGKTSLLRIATGLATPEDGAVLWGDEPVRRSAAFRRDMVYIGHANALKDDLTVCESLAFLACMHGRNDALPALHAALGRFGLQSRRDAPVRTLSQGQRRRVALARLALEERAALWVLDEPFDALDVDGVATLNTLLAAHQGRGGSILLTSHLTFATAALSPTEFNLDAHEPVRAAAR